MRLKTVEESYRKVTNIYSFGNSIDFLFSVVYTLPEAQKGSVHLW